VIATTAAATAMANTNFADASIVLITGSYETE